MVSERVLTLGTLCAHVLRSVLRQTTLIKVVCCAHSHTYFFFKQHSKTANTPKYNYVIQW